MSQRLISSVSGSKSMSSTLESPPILSSGQTDGIYSIHDTFVVGDCSEGIFHGELVGFHDFLGHFETSVTFPGHVLDGNGEGTGGSSFDAVIGEDGNTGFYAHAADDLFGFLGQSVDDVGAHGLFDVDQYVKRVVVSAHYFIIEVSKANILDSSVSFGH